MKNAWKWLWRKLGWPMPDCPECNDSGWVSKETWIGARGFRTGNRCECGTVPGSNLKFL